MASREQLMVKLQVRYRVLCHSSLPLHCIISHPLLVVEVQKNGKNWKRKNILWNCPIQRENVFCLCIFAKFTQIMYHHHHRQHHHHKYKHKPLVLLRQLVFPENLHLFFESDFARFVKTLLTETVKQETHASQISVIWEKFSSEHSSYIQLSLPDLSKHS